MISKNRKKEIISQVAMSQNDTGSTQVQIAILSERIKEISGHLGKFPKDNHSRLGLVKLVGKMRRLNKYKERT